MRIGTTEILFFIGLVLLILFTIEIIKFLGLTCNSLTFILCMLFYKNIEGCNLAYEETICHCAQTH